MQLALEMDGYCHSLWRVESDDAVVTGTPMKASCVSLGRVEEAPVMWPEELDAKSTDKGGGSSHDTGSGIADSSGQCHGDSNTFASSFESITRLLEKQHEDVMRRLGGIEARLKHNVACCNDEERPCDTDLDTVGEPCDVELQPSSEVAVAAPVENNAPSTRSAPQEYLEDVGARRSFVPETKIAEDCDSEDEEEHQMRISAGMSSRQAKKLFLGDASDRAKARWGSAMYINGEYLLQAAQNRTTLHAKSGEISRSAVKQFRKALSAKLASVQYDCIIGCVLLVNLAVMGYEITLRADGEEPGPFLQVVDLTFVGLYTLDCMVNIFATPKAILHRPLFQVDAFIVLCGWAEVAIGSMGDAANQGPLQQAGMLKLLRMVRVVRAVRLLVHCRPLFILVQGLIHSLDTLVWTFVIMASMIYVFALLGMELISEGQSDDPEFNSVAKLHFSSLSDTMLTLLQVITLDSIGAIYTPLIRGAPWLVLYFVMFILLGSVSLMNLVTAILVQTAQQTANHDALVRKMSRQAHAREAAPLLKNLFFALDSDGDGEITYEEIKGAPAWVHDKIEALADRIDIEEIFEMLDQDSNGSVSIHEFVDGILRAGEDGVPLEVIRILSVCLELRTTLRHAPWRTHQQFVQQTVGSQSRLDEPSNP